MRRRARELGADLVGIAPAALEPEPGDPRAYEAWVAKGMHGSMAYMARDPSVRSSITRWFPQARSVVLMAFSYSGRSGTAREATHGSGRFARYSLSDDYHAILGAKTRALLDWFASLGPRVEGKAFVDTSPVLERLYARRAGLGWTGKNTMLVSPKLGSFFFLAGAAVDAELEPDEPMPDHCGTCDRCLKACPTAAFPAPRVLDASRCVAYLTIEHRGAVPEGLRGGCGDWVFGCDVCQKACPFNRFAVTNPIFTPRLSEEESLEALVGLDERRFKERFKPTPVERAGIAGLKRNSLLAMGNSGEARFIPLLERFARDPDPVLAEQARWSLARLSALPAPSEL